MTLTKTGLALLSAASLCAMDAAAANDPEAAPTVAPVGVELSGGLSHVAWRDTVGDLSTPAATARAGIGLGRYLAVEAEASVGLGEPAHDEGKYTAYVKLNHQVAGYAVARLPMGENFRVFARGGYGTAMIERDRWYGQAAGPRVAPGSSRAAPAVTSASNGPVEIVVTGAKSSFGQDEATLSGPTAGVGAELISGPFHLRADYTHHFVEAPLIATDGVQALTLTVGLRF